MQDSRFAGIPYPITRHPRGFLHSTYGTNQIKADLLQLLLTNPGERCLTGDTRIPLANGKEFAIKDLVEEKAFWVYSFDIETNMVLPGLATAHKTMIDAELMEIKLDNEECIRCTPNHLWLTRNGKYIRADELCEGMSLMPLYRHLNASKYEKVYQPSLLNYKETHFCFVAEKRLKGVREVVHHKDSNKRNNAPDNLQWMTREAHKQLNRETRNVFNTKIKNNPEFKQKWIKDGLKKYYPNHDRNRQGATSTQETKYKLSKVKKEYFQTEEKVLQDGGSSFKGQIHSADSVEKVKGERPSATVNNNHSKRETWVVRGEKKNHKVLSVRKIETREDCYDLSVEKYNNFGLSAGVFVHNCMLPSYGTALRKLLFDPNDAFLEEAARTMIINSINQWEPRIKVEKIEVSRNVDQNYLNPNDSKEDLENILMIKIMFVDFLNLQEIDELKLELPIGGGK